MTAVFALFLFPGCSSLPWNETSYNIDNSKRLRVGMTKEEVQAIMGDPVKDEVYCQPDVWFYYTHIVWMDGMVVEEECTPMVFQNSKLIGWGNEFYTRYRLNKQKGSNKIDL